MMLDAYLAGQVLRRMLVVFAALLALFALVTFIGELGEAADGYGAAVIAQFTLLRLPGFATALFPMALLLGAVLGLGQLAATSELVAVRAAGRSVLRIALSVLMAGAPLAVAAVLVGEALAPQTERRAEQVRAAALQDDIAATGQNLWLRDGNDIARIGEVLPDNSLRDVKVFAVANGALRSVTHAAHASHTVDGWRLHNVTVTDLSGAAQTVRYETLAWTFALQPTLFNAWQTRPAQLSLTDLRRHIVHLRANAQRTAEFELAWWNKLLLPVTAAVMLLLAIPCVFAHPRTAAVERGMLTGVLVGIGFYILSRACGYFVLLGGIPPLLGALAPAVIFLSGALWWMVWRR